ncbi:MAG: hypothetical protein EBZ60_08025, partial [Betaproteobacteria bacterium]|nr:hypothetical protein [Betaproteobacteria bacterium]
TFQGQQSQLDRTAQSDLAKANRDFQAAQSQLDRDNQTALIKLQDSINQGNVSKAFAANLATGTLNAINAIQMDPNLDANAKKAAIQNVIDTGNATMQWGSTFYNTSLPSIGAPGSATTTITPTPSSSPNAGSPVTLNPGGTAPATNAGSGIINNVVQPPAPDYDEYGLDRNDPNYESRRNTAEQTYSVGG